MGKVKLNHQSLKSTSQELPDIEHFFTVLSFVPGKRHFYRTVAEIAQIILWLPHRVMLSINLVFDIQILLFASDFQCKMMPLK